LRGGGLQREEQGHFPHTVNRNGELHVDPDHYGMALVSCFSAEYDLLFISSSSRSFRTSLSAIFNTP
jgi:hypothetical protein